MRTLTRFESSDESSDERREAASTGRGRVRRAAAYTRFGAITGARAALVGFCVIAALAAHFYLDLGRGWWFYLDEWNVVASRGAGNVGDLLRPYNQHWTTLPILTWRVLWNAVGARSYRPYEALSVSLHVIVAVLCRCVMRRAAVRPWTATLVAGVFLFFGSGAQNILSAFQIAFTGALAFGLAHLLLADHDGPLDQRDWLGLGAGCLALMCSGVGVTMVAVVGVATALRRGRRAAAFHTAPLVAIYLAWYARYGRSGTKFTGGLGATFAFARTGIAATFNALGQVSGVGTVLALSLVVGLGFLWKASARPARAAQLAIPTALLVGTLVFFVTAAVGQKSGPDVTAVPEVSRYLYVAAALLTPVIAIAIEVLHRRAHVFGTLVMALLLVGIPGNLTQASDLARFQAQRVASTRALLLSIARMPLNTQAPGTLRPDPITAPSVTLQWLRNEIGKGHIPQAENPTASLLANNQLRLSLMELDSSVSRPCPPLTTPVTRHLARGQEIAIGDGAVTITDLSSNGTPGSVTFGNTIFRSSRLDHTLRSVIGQLTIRVAPAVGHRAQLC